MVELKVRIGPKGQIVIPKVFRDHFKLFPGEQIILKEDAEGVLITNIADSKGEDFLKIAEKVQTYGKPKYNKKMIYEQYNRKTKY